MTNNWERTMTRRALLGLLGAGGITLASQVIPPSVSLGAQLDDNAFNVRDYGATGDGKTNDQQSIQQAIDACAKAGGGTVFFPKGNYLMSSRIFINVSNIRLQGDFARITKPANNESGMVNIKGSWVDICGLTFENQNEKAANILFFSPGSKQLTIRSCTFTGKRVQAIDINAAQIANVLIQDCLFDAVNYGVLCNYGASDLEGLRITGNRFVNIYGDAIELNCPITNRERAVYDSANSIIISNNFISVPQGLGTGNTAGFGLGMAGVTRVSVIGNIFKDCRYEAIHVEDHCRNISIVGNIIDGVQADPDNQLNSGIYVINAEQITITSNEIRNCNNYGIHFEYSKTEQGSKVTIVGNNISECVSGGIRYAGSDWSDTVISGNVITDNQGHGIQLAGSSDSLQLTGNIIRANGGYGIVLEQSKMVSITNNTIYENASGTIFVRKPSYTFPVGKTHTILTQTGDQWMDALSLGVYAEGHLHMTAKTGSNFESFLYALVWDEVNLTLRLLKQKGNRVIAVPAPKMNGSLLQVNATSAAALTAPLTIDVQFDGIIMMR